MKKWGSFISRIFGKRPKRLAYVIWNTGLSGGTKVLLEHVRYLNQKGVPAVAFSKDPYPSWYPYQVPFERIKKWDEIRGFDWIVVSYFLALLELWEYPTLRRRLIHFSQGFEGDYEEAKSVLDLVQKAYRLPCPVWAVSESLALRLKRLFPQMNPYVVGQGLDFNVFYPLKNHPPSPPVRIVLIGHWGISIKRIPWGLKILRQLKEEFNDQIETIRVSPVDTRAQEASIFLADRYLVALSPQEVAQVLRQSHVLFSPSTKAEGFGLPALEALACGVATCLSAIDSYLSWDHQTDYAAFFAPEDATGAYQQLKLLVLSAQERLKLRRRGLQVSRKFSFVRVIRRIEAWLNLNKSIIK